MGRSDYYSSYSCKLTTKFAFLFTGPRKQIQNNTVAAINLRSVPPLACTPNNATRDFRPYTSPSGCFSEVTFAFPVLHAAVTRQQWSSAGGESERPQNPQTPRPALSVRRADLTAAAPSAAAGSVCAGAQTSPNEATVANSAKYRARKINGKRTFLNFQLGSSEGSLPDTCFWCEQQNIFQHTGYAWLSASLGKHLACPAGMKHPSPHREKATINSRPPPAPPSRSRPSPEHTAFSPGNTRGEKITALPAVTAGFGGKKKKY